MTWWRSLSNADASAFALAGLLVDMQVLPGVLMVLTGICMLTHMVTERKIVWARIA